MKICAKCEESKPLESFIRDNRRNDGRGSWCRDCHKTCPSMKLKEPLATFCKVCGNPLDTGRGDRIYCSNRCGSIYRNQKYKLSMKGMTEDEFFNMLKRQNFKCVLCLRSETSTSKHILSIDHCHKTNRVRGLLCHKCNAALGLLNDDVDVFKRAISYLEA